MRDGQEVPNPDGKSGLYIRKQNGAVVQVRVPADHIAFQMGEAMQACSVTSCDQSFDRTIFQFISAVCSSEQCVDVSDAITVVRRASFPSQMQGSAFPPRSGFIACPIVIYNSGC